MKATRFVEASSTQNTSPKDSMDEYQLFYQFYSSLYKYLNFLNTLQGVGKATGKARKLRSNIISRL